MVLVEFAVGGFVLCAFLFTAYKYQSSSTGVWGMIGWRKPPYIVNLEEMHLTRAAGLNWLVDKGNGYCDIFYSEGMMKTGVYRDVPRYFVQEKYAGQTKHPEGIVMIYPYSMGSTGHLFLDAYRQLAHQSYKKWQDAESMLLELSDAAQTATNLDAIQGRLQGILAVHKQMSLGIGDQLGRNEASLNAALFTNMEPKKGEGRKFVQGPEITQT
ncbi:MAG: hypothetical protein WC759_04500 [Candidatus Micrarchaeia archaeon]|jgi:hypothetical protein